MEFEQGAEMVRQRSWLLCEVCHARGSQTHHRQPRGMGGVSGVGLSVNLPSGLIRVCDLCHRTIESQREWAYEMGYLVARPTPPRDVPVFLRHVQGTGWWLLRDDGCMQWQDLPEPCVPSRRM